MTYFAKHVPHGLRWAIAGRHRDRLEMARALAGGPPRSEDMLVADSQDQASVDAVVSRTRVLLSTAGPFARYGTPVVDACVRLGTDYVDITGETPWMKEIAARYHHQAAGNGTRIIPACGFDSVPSDLGTLLMARHFQDTLGVPCAEVRSYFRFRAGLNGGTVASLLNMLEGRQGGRVGHVGRVGDSADSESAEPPSSPTKPTRVAVRMVKAPRHDPELGTWIGPFVMAPTNTTVVRRSAKLFAEWQQPYAPEFMYQEAMKYNPPLARVKAMSGAASLGLLFTLLQRPGTRRLVQRFLPRPGEGPSVKAMDSGWFTCDLLGLERMAGRRVA